MTHWDKARNKEVVYLYLKHSIYYQFHLILTLLSHFNIIWWAELWLLALWSITRKWQDTEVCFLLILRCPFFLFFFIILTFIHRLFFLPFFILWNLNNLIILPVCPFYRLPVLPVYPFYPTIRFTHRKKNVLPAYMFYPSNHFTQLPVYQFTHIPLNTTFISLPYLPFNPFYLSTQFTCLPNLLLFLLYMFYTFYLFYPFYQLNLDKSD